MPQESPPQLDYRIRTRASGGPSWPRKFIADAVLGGVLAGFCLGVGFCLALRSEGSAFVGLLFGPQILSLALAAYFAIQFRRFGFVAGVVLVNLVVFPLMRLISGVHGIC